MLKTAMPDAKIRMMKAQMLILQLMGTASSDMDVRSEMCA
jgi:hypothetical protein